MQVNITSLFFIPSTYGGRRPSFSMSLSSRSTKDFLTKMLTKPGPAHSARSITSEPAGMFSSILLAMSRGAILVPWPCKKYGKAMQFNGWFKQAIFWSESHSDTHCPSLLSIHFSSINIQRTFSYSGSVGRVKAGTWLNSCLQPSNKGKQYNPTVAQHSAWLIVWQWNANPIWNPKASHSLIGTVSIFDLPRNNVSAFGRLLSEGIFVSSSKCDYFNKVCHL